MESKDEKHRDGASGLTMGKNARELPKKWGHALPVSGHSPLQLVPVSRRERLKGRLGEEAGAVAPVVIGELTNEEVEEISRTHVDPRETHIEGLIVFESIDLSSSCTLAGSTLDNDPGLRADDIGGPRYEECIVLPVLLGLIAERPETHTALEFQR